MDSINKYTGLAVVGFIFILILSVLWTDKHYLAFSLVMIFLVLISFYIGFEKKNIEAEEVILISILSAIAAISRVPFASIPSVQPTTFVIMMSAMSFGREVGFLVGSTAALVSNIVLGQGPWTPWQMFGWGMVGLTAGILKDTYFLKNKIGRSIFGFIWGFLFGWIMNLWMVLYFETESLSWKLFFGSCISSFKFDLAHALSNVFFISFFGDRWIKIFNRVKIKYGILKE